MGDCVVVGGVVPVGDEVAVGRAVSVGDVRTVSIRMSVDVNSIEGEGVSIGVDGSTVIEIALVLARLGGRLGVGEIAGKGVAMTTSIPAVEKRPDKPKQNKTMPPMNEIVIQAGLFIAALLSGRMRLTWRPSRRISPAASYPCGE
jgi:hypothetical protein